MTQHTKSKPTPIRAIERQRRFITLPLVLGALAAGCAAPAAPSVGPEAALQVAAAPPGSPPATPSAPERDAGRPPTPPVRVHPSPGYKIGAPYTVGSRTFVPAEDSTYDAIGLASWYGDGFHGKPTANGEIYDMNALVAAHPTLPMPSYVHVTNLRNGRTVLLRVNNRGPFAPGRIIDVSREAANLLGFANNGVTQVRVRYVGRAPLDGRTDRERSHLAAQGWYRAAAMRSVSNVPR